MTGIRTSRKRRAGTGGVVLALLCAVVATAAIVTTTRAEAGPSFNDRAAASFTITATKWASVCVTGSDETRPGEVFTVGASAPLGTQGWTTIVDKNSATTVAEFAGCSILLFAGENLGVTADKYRLLMAWFNSGGAVMTTGNDNGGNSVHGVFLMPDILTSSEVLYSGIPYGGAIRIPAAADSIRPKFPTWTPGTNPALDSYATVVTPAPGATCVAQMRTDPRLCAAITKQNANGGKWVHIHTKIGSMSQPGDHPLADAALIWLTS